MTQLQRFLGAQVERRLREKEQDLKGRCRGQTPEVGYENGVRAALAALADVFSTPALQKDLGEVLAMEANRVANTVPHPRSRSYRSEPEGWSVLDTRPQEVLAEIRTLAKSKRNPAVVFDLDGTLFEVSHRTLGILREWQKSPESCRFSAPLLRRIESIDLCHMGYALGQAFENAGLDVRSEETADLLHSAEKFWRRKFFDGKALVDFDEPVPGAHAFVRTLAQEGIRICYLTGREHRGMNTGTLRQLEKHGFPVGDDTSLMLKLNHELEDHAFKQAAFADLSERFDVVANFENEYINISHMVPHAPDACHVILDTQHSGRPVPAGPVRVRRMADYLME